MYVCMYVVYATYGIDVSCVMYAMYVHLRYVCMLFMYVRNVCMCVMYFV